MYETFNLNPVSVFWSVFHILPCDWEYIMYGLTSLVHPSKAGPEIMFAYTIPTIYISLDYKSDTSDGMADSDHLYFLVTIVIILWGLRVISY